MSENKRHISDWINKADQDLGSAKLIFLHIPDYSDTIAFHCQQAVEKYLKAILLYYMTEFQHTHNLVYLLDLLSKHVEIVEDKYDKAILLNGFSVQIRYPNQLIHLTEDELKIAISIADDFRQFAIQIIGINNLK